MAGKENQIVISFAGLTVTSIGPSSGVFIGKNNAIGWSAHGKSNAGLGSVSGKVLHNINVVYDSRLSNQSAALCFSRYQGFALRAFARIFHIRYAYPTAGF